VVKVLFVVSLLWKKKTKVASAGNRTRAARVAGEHSTTEPPMLRLIEKGQNNVNGIINYIDLEDRISLKIFLSVVFNYFRTFS
jgi:hypothetical protein